jgi:hypothetical protein
VGIDITEEVAAIRATDGAKAEGAQATAAIVTRKTMGERGGLS